MKSLELHRNHVTKFQPINKVLNTRSHVTTSGPKVFREENVFGRNSQKLSQPSVIKLNTFLCKKLVVIFVVKDLNSDHGKPRVMSTSQTDVIQIVKPNAKLRTNQRIGWRSHLSSHTVGLETVNACLDKFNVISPSGNDWISIDLFTGDSLCGKGFFEVIPNLAQSVLFVPLLLANEPIGSNAVAVSTDCLVLILVPKEIVALLASVSEEPVLFKELNRVILLVVLLEFCSEFLLNLFGTHNLNHFFLLIFLLILNCHSCSL